MAAEIGKPRKWTVWLLFASSTTLLCCALPILFVSLGMGAAVASLYGDYLPWLRWFGLNEGITFGTTATILVVAGWVLYRPGRACRVDPKLAESCSAANRWNLRFYWVSIAIWCIGAFSTFALPWLQS